MALYYKGPNSTADIVLIRLTDQPDDYEVLLIQRHHQSEACPGLYAFPGGFVNSNRLPDGTAQLTETPEQAAWRELAEETGLHLQKPLTIHCIGAFDQRQRDPRNTSEAWVQSFVFTALVPAGFGPDVQGLDDAEPGKTAWYSLKALQQSQASLAFDHGLILDECCLFHQITPPSLSSWSSVPLSKPFTRIVP